MSQYPTDEQVVPHAPPAAGTPPIEGAFVPDKRSVWPTVIGIITIIFGSLGAAYNGLCSPAGMIMAGAFKPMFEDMAQSAPGAGMEMQVAQIEAMSRYLPASLVVYLTSTILSVLLLIGGIGVLRRRGWSGRTLNIWAILRILQAIPAVIVTYLMNDAMFEAMEEAAASGGGATAQMPSGIFSVMATVGLAAVIIQLLIYWALPVFVLIWFSRRVIREEVAEWRG